MKKFVGRAVAMMAAHPGPFSLFWVTTLLQLAYKVGTAFCARVIFDDGITHGNSRVLAARWGLDFLLSLRWCGDGAGARYGAAGHADRKWLSPPAVREAAFGIAPIPSQSWA